MRLVCLVAAAAGLTFGLLFVVLLAHGQAPDKPRLDLFGDPLPEHAVARLGCLRLRHPTTIQHLAFSPDGKRLASWGGRIARLWDVATGKLHREISAPDTRAPNSGLVVSLPDGTNWLAVGLMNSVSLYDTASGKQGGVIKLSDHFLFPSFQVRFTRDSKILAAAGREGIAVWDAGSGKQLNSKLLAPNTTVSLALYLAADGKTLTVLSERNVLSWWNVTDGRMRKKQEGIVKYSIWHATFSPDCRLSLALQQWWRNPCWCWI